MLAATIEDVSKLEYPLLATPKIDGIRCLVLGDGRVVSRTFKPIANNFICKCLSSASLRYLDGELVVGNNFQETSSGVMSIDGAPDFIYKVFDCWAHPEWSYIERLDELALFIGEHHFPCHQFLWPERVDDEMQLQMKMKTFLQEGYEGIMLRRADAPYKCGRSTLREGYLMKLKPFLDAEAVVTDFEERMHNANPETADNFGLAKHSSCNAGMIPEDTLGALWVHHDIYGPFKIGSGFTDKERKDIWDNQDYFRGKVVTFKYQKHGMKDKPRCPVFKCWRKDI